VWATGKRINGFRNPHGENALLVQHIAQGGVIQCQIASQRVDGRDGARPDPRDRLLHMPTKGST